MKINFILQIHLMQCDVQLWKQLTELYASITLLKDNIKRETLYLESSSVSSSASSDTESFVSAEEYSEDNYSDYFQDRVLSWINQCDSDDTLSDDSAKEDKTVDRFTLRSQTYDEIPSGNRADEPVKDFLFQTCFTAIPLNTTIANVCSHSSSDLQDVLHLNRSAAILTGIFNMKSLEETQIVSERNFGYYKTSLRLLGSVRMRSRIFQPHLTKWRPFALSQSADSFIIAPPTAYSNIQPRPKLHRVCEVFDKTLFQNYEQNAQKHKSDLQVGSMNQNEDTYKTAKDKISVSETAIGSVQKINRFNSGLIVAINTEKDLNSETKVREIPESNVNICEAEMCVSVDIERKSRSPSEGLDSDGTTDSENVSEKSFDDTDLFLPNFLEIKDGLIRCRIMSPNLEQELDRSIIDQDDFKYLMLVDGRVTFTPHTKDNDNEESYFLGWLFENNKTEDADDDLYYINFLFDETDKNETNIALGHKESCFVYSMFSERDNECVITVGNDECDEPFYIYDLFEDKAADPEYDEFWDSYHINELFEQDIKNEIHTRKKHDFC